MALKQTPQLNDDWIDPDALDIIRQLQRRGHTTYLVGGCVRDLLIGRQPKDFDIVTDANPRQIKTAVRNSYIIGKRFRLVLAKRGEKLFEISTFRQNPKNEFPEELSEEGAPEETEILGEDNLFGTPEEDARRRDFTINALFYDPTKKKVFDYVNGLDDLKEGVVRMIGDLMVRLEEDPIRIMRGIRLSHMIRFALEPSLREGMVKLGHLLPATPLPRRREELLKFLRLDDPARPFLTAHDLDILKFIVPSAESLIGSEDKSATFIESLHAFRDLKLDSPADLFAGFSLLYCKAAHDLKIAPGTPMQSILEGDDVTELMRNELGMFNAEQSRFKKGLALAAQIQKRAEFERRGERRRWALFRNDGFDLALALADSLYLLSADDLQFWRDSYDARPKDLIEKSSHTKKRRRRPRKKPSDQQPQPNSSSDK